jgi:hypothetical protein
MRSPFELKSLIDWLEKQPADAEYDYLNNDDCLLCRYFRSVGLPLAGVAPVGGSHWTDDRWESRPLPDTLRATSRREPWNYGAALERARALLAKQPS